MMIILELAVGFNTNLNINAKRKKEQYQQLLQTLNSQLYLVKFVAMSVRCLGAFRRYANAFIHTFKDIHLFL